MKNVKTALNVIVIIAILWTNNLKADQEALRLCDEALTNCEKTIKTKDEVIDAQEELIKKLASQRNEAFDRLGDEQSGTPWYLLVLIGIAGGIVLNSTVISK